jgi:hypothetical protein
LKLQTVIRPVLALAVAGAIVMAVRAVWNQQRQPRYQGKSVAEWVNTGARSESTAEFFRAIEAIGVRSVPSLCEIALTASRDRDSRWNRWVGRLPREVSVLVPGALEWDVTHQRAALLGLGRVGAKEDQSLGVLLWAVSVPEISEAAANILVMWKDRVLEHPAGMATVAMTSPHLACRTNALRVLWNLGSAAEPWMVSLRASSEPEVLVTSEIGLLYWRGMKRAAIEKLDQLVFEGKQLNGGTGRIAVQETMALQIMGWIGPGLEPMAKEWVLRFRTVSEPSEREILSSLMGAMGDVDPGFREEMMDVLLEALEKETDSSARFSEIRALGGLGRDSNRVVERLESLLQGSDEETIAESRQALERIRNRVNRE